MQKSVGIWHASYQELQHVRTITTAAMFMAVSAVLGYFTIEAGPYLKIGFSTVANQLVYYLFGPVVGACYGGIFDVLRYVVKPTGAFFFGFTFNAIFGGVLYGALLYRKPLKLWRCLLAHFAVSLVCNVCLNTLWLSMISGKGVLALLPIRLAKNLIQWPVDSVLFYGLAKKLEGAGLMRLIRGMTAVSEEKLHKSL